VRRVVQGFLKGPEESQRCSLLAFFQHYYQHNDNIREDRKMTKEEFWKNNRDYGRDITEEGQELPREFLDSVYVSIREEEIRTLGEGADGCMTVERWKDVLRGSTEDTDSMHSSLPTEHDAEDLTELVLEHVWKPMIPRLVLYGAWICRKSRCSCQVLWASGLTVHTVACWDPRGLVLVWTWSSKC
jgi:hypothetical protein